MPDTNLPHGRSVTAALLPFALIVLLGYAAVGIPLSTLPLVVHGRMGFGITTVGVVIGLGPVVTLLTRQIAGRLADRRGATFGVLVGLVTTAASGVAYLGSLGLPPGYDLAALLAGRALLGLGDSLFTTAIMAWTVATVGAGNAGRAMSWVGIAMYAALAIGAPAGVLLDGIGGFAAVCVAVAVAPLLAIPIALSLTRLPARGPGRKVRLLRVLAGMWRYGVSLVLASGGFGTIAAFLALRYEALGWPGAGLALTAFGAAYIASRLLFAGLPDRLGGSRVAMICLVTEAAGLVLIAVAWSPAAALIGSALAGLGYSMVFPSLGVEVVRVVPAETRGVALGAFLACFDLGLGGAGPVMGVIASGFGLPSAFLAAAVAALLSLALVWANRR